MKDFEERVLSDLAVLKEQMRSLVGNGRPGRLDALEQRVAKHENYVQRALGIGALLSAIVAGVHFLVDLVKLRH